MIRLWLKPIRKNIRTRGKKNIRHPRTPPRLAEVGCYVLFQPHGISLDFEGIRPYLKEADIYLYEDPSHNVVVRRQLQQLSLAPTFDRDQIDDNGRKPILDELYDSKKIVDTIDLRSVGEEKEIALNLLGVWGSDKDPKTESFKESTEWLGRLLAERAELQHQRQTIMADRFEEEIEAILASHPELKEKSNLKIVLSMGSYHTMLRHTFSEKGIPSERQFSTPHGYTYDYFNQAQREFAYGKEPSQDLLEKAYIGDIITGMLSRKLTDQSPSDDISLYGRLVTSKLDHEKMENIYALHAKGKLTMEALDSLFEDMGLQKLPTTAEEIKQTIEARQIGQSSEENLLLAA